MTSVTTWAGHPRAEFSAAGVNHEPLHVMPAAPGRRARVVIVPGGWTSWPTPAAWYTTRAGCAGGWRPTGTCTSAACCPGTRSPRPRPRWRTGCVLVAGPMTRARRPRGRTRGQRAGRAVRRGLPRGADQRRVQPDPLPGSAARAGPAHPRAAGVLLPGEGAARDLPGTARCPYPGQVRPPRLRGVRHPGHADELDPADGHPGAARRAGGAARRPSRPAPAAAAARPDRAWLGDHELRMR